MSNLGTTSTNGGIEEKVKWATAASSLVTFVLTALANAVRDTDHGLLLTGIPDAAEPFLLTLIVGLPTLWAGWQAKHTHRPDLRPGGAPTVP